MINENIIVEALAVWLPRGRRRTVKGWESMNCVMCHLNGEPTPDKKRKGGVIFTGPSFTYRCFRCKFKAHWRPGMYISRNVERLFKALGMSDDTILELKTHAITLRQFVDLETEFGPGNALQEFEEVELPKKSKPISLISGGGENFQNVVAYLQTLGKRIYDNDIYWSSIEDYQMNKRFIIPFYYQGKIVGYTARYCEKNPPSHISKYHSVQPNGYLYNNHFLDDYNRKYVVVVEGPLDAKSIGAVGTLGNEMNQAQINWLKHSGKEIIILPDRDEAGMRILDVAIENDFWVAFPDWDYQIKDAHQACQKYGAVWTARSIIDSKVKGEVRIKQSAKFWL